MDKLLTLEQQNMLVQTLGDLIVATGVVEPAPFTGPELVEFGIAAKNHIEYLQAHQDLS